MNYINGFVTLCMIMCLENRIEYMRSIHILNSKSACDKHCHKLASMGYVFQMWEFTNPQTFLYTNVRQMSDANNFGHKIGIPRDNIYNGPLARFVKLRFAHALGTPGTFSPRPWVNNPGMHHGTCVTHVP